MTEKLLKTVFDHYPKAKDCIDGHLGVEVEVIEEELDDDRYRRIKFKRCSHCGLPVSGDTYV